MLNYPKMSPDIISIGPVKIRWYGFMYVLGFIIAYFLIRNEARRKELGLNDEQVYDLIFYLILGVILGGRIGYILFYNLPFYMSHPLDVLKIYQGGMSFHGGLIGPIVAGFIYCKKRGIRFLPLADVGFMAGALGLGFGRIGNFINGELYGRVTTPDFPLAMIFPSDPTQQPRHPSQLYESFFEGFLMFAILYWLNRKNYKPGTVIGAFLALYGTFRFFIEYVRQPDAQLGLLFGGFLSMGQILCIPMIVIGIAMIFYFNFIAKNNPPVALKNHNVDSPISEGETSI